MEGPFQLSSQRGRRRSRTDPRPAVFLLRRIETTPEYAHYRGLRGAHAERRDAWDRPWPAGSGSEYRVFWFEHTDSDRDAFERECRLWHELDGHAGKLDNDCHPRPDGITGGHCPLCTAPAPAGAA